MIPVLFSNPTEVENNEVSILRKELSLPMGLSVQSTAFDIMASTQAAANYTTDTTHSVDSCLHNYSKAMLHTQNSSIYCRMIKFKLCTSK